MLKQLSTLNLISNVVIAPAAVALVGTDEGKRFDSVFDKYVEQTKLDEDLFDLGPYNQKERTNGIAYGFLATSAELAQAMLSWCPSCSADKTFLKDYLFLIFDIFVI